MPTEIIENIFENQAITQNNAVTSPRIFIGDADLSWKFSVEGIFQSAGAATVKLEVLTSIDGVNFVDMDTDIKTGWAKATRAIYDVDPSFSNWVQIKATEENAGAVTGLYLSFLKGVA